MTATPSGNILVCSVKFFSIYLGNKPQTPRLEHSLSAENVRNANGINNNFSTVPSPTASESSSSAGYSSNNPSINSEQSFNEDDEEENNDEDGWETDDFYESDDDILDSKKDSDVLHEVRMYLINVIYSFNRIFEIDIGNLCV